MLKNLLLFISIILLLFGITPFQGTGQPITTRCGEETVTLPDIKFAGVSFTNDALHYQQMDQSPSIDFIDLAATPVNSIPLQPQEVWSYPMISLSDGSLAYLSYVADGKRRIPFTLNVLRPDGTHLTLPTSEETHFWIERLITEVRPNVFTVLILGERMTVYWAEISIQGSSLAVGHLQLLNLEHYGNSGMGVFLQTSPSGRYVFHHEILKSVYVIYDLHQNQRLWEHPFTEGLPTLIWTEDTELIVLVGFTTDLLMPVSGDVIGVYQDGRSEKRLDLEAAMGMPFVMGNGVALGADSSQVVFWGRGRTPESVGKQPLMRFNYQTGELVDLCIRGDETSLYADPQGQYVLFNEMIPPDQHCLGVVSVETGDYRYFTTEEALYILPNTFETVR